MSQVRISPAKIEKDQEKRIILNLIVDDDFAKAIVPIAEPDYFDVPYCKTLFFWLRDYFKQYNAAPKKIISDIYNIRKAKLSPEDAELIGDFLQEISQQYSQEEKRNTQYLIETSKPYLKKKYYERMAEKISSNAKLGNIQECENILANNKGFSEFKAQYVNFHDEETVSSIVENKEKNILFKIEGAIGELIGPIRRGELYGILGKTNIGKSFLLREILFQALLNKLKCVEFNFEMQKESVGFRHFKRISGLGEEAKIQLYPVFDCMKNAMGSCRLKQRTSKVELVNGSGEIPEYGFHNKDYIPCSVCRGGRDYEIFTWYEPIFKKELTPSNIKSAVSSFKMMYGDNLRTCCFPKFTATVGDCEHQLDMMEYLEEFVPDFGIWDYDDIIRSETKYIDPLDASDEVYKRICGTLQKRKMGGFIGMQLNRTGAKKKKASTFDLSGNFKKMMHLDGCIVLDQTDEEKIAGILRASVGKLRDGQFVSSKEVLILQQLQTGQPLLDSEWGKEVYEE